MIRFRHYMHHPAGDPQSEDRNRLFELPFELRYKIYEGVLTCDTAIEDGIPDTLRGDGLPQNYTAYDLFKGPSYVNHGVNTNLLRTCRQAYSEAYPIMLQKNVFVHVEAHTGRFAVKLQQDQFGNSYQSEQTDVENYCIPVLAMGTKAANFKNPAVQLRIVQPKGFRPHLNVPSRYGKADYLILAHHLPQFMEAYSGRCFLAMHEMHADDFHGEFHLIHNADFHVGRHQQEQLLKSWQIHRLEIANLTFPGDWDGDLACAAFEQVDILQECDSHHVVGRKGKVSPLEAIEFFEYRKRVADEHFRKEEFRNAFHHWHIGKRMKQKTGRAAPYRLHTQLFREGNYDLAQRYASVCLGLLTDYAAWLWQSAKTGRRMEHLVVRAIASEVAAIDRMALDILHELDVRQWSTKEHTVLRMKLTERLEETLRVEEDLGKVDQASWELLRAHTKKELKTWEGANNQVRLPTFLFGDSFVSEL